MKTFRETLNKIHKLNCYNLCLEIPFFFNKNEVLLVEIPIFCFNLNQAKKISEEIVKDFNIKNPHNKIYDYKIWRTNSLYKKFREKLRTRIPLFLNYDKLLKANLDMASFDLKKQISWIDSKDKINENYFII